MDELENVIILSEAHARLMRGDTYCDGDNVVISGGQKGILHGYCFSMSGVRRENFSISSLFSHALSPSFEQGNDLARIVRLSYVASQSMVIAASADHVIFLYSMYV